MDRITKSNIRKEIANRTSEDVNRERGRHENVATIQDRFNERIFRQGK